MAELISMTYEQARAEHFKTLKDEAERKMNYWAARVYRSRPNDLNDPAHIRAGEYAAEYSYYKDALEALEDNRFQYETGFVKGFESAQPKWISVEERLPVFRRPVLRRMLNMTIKEMFDIMGESYMLCQTAEEACELGKASLKVVRAMEGKTPVR